MKSKQKLRIGIIFILLLTFFTLPGFAQMVSKPGEYSGYSPQLYNEWVRYSQYVEVRDGTKLAVDWYRPAVNGVAVETPYPVVWTNTAYRGRGTVSSNGIRTLGPVQNGMIELTKYGYVVAAVDVRGTGASFGTRHIELDRTEAWDAYDMNEWFARQPWSSGITGMWGCSQIGENQFHAISTMPPSLKAALPFACSPEKYDSWWGGKGIRQVRPNPAPWTADLATLPVDGDTDASGDGYPDMLYAAAFQHQNPYFLGTAIAEAPYRDSLSAYAGSTLWEEISATTYRTQIEQSKVAMYHWVNWNDESATWGTHFSYATFRNPSKLYVGYYPNTLSGHCRYGYGFNAVTEHLRFYDYWLKGVKNDIMDQPPIYYITVGADTGKEWRYSWAWPLPNEKRLKYYLHAGPSGSTNSRNDGVLSMTPPQGTVDKDNYDAVYGITKDTMTANALTYTTSPFASDVEVTGHPLIDLWVSSTATDGDLFVFLEDLAQDGTSRFIGMDKVRASLRALHKPVYNTIGTPWRRAYAEDESFLIPGKPVRLAMNSWPTSTLFRAGHRLRLTITADYPRGHWIMGPYAEMTLPPLTPSPTLSVYRNAIHASFISLPVTTDPIKVAVEAKPEILNHKSKGDFTVFITPSHKLGKGYRAKDIDISTLMCNGASAINGYVTHDTLIAKFKRQDFVDTSTGHTMKLNVTGKFYYDIPFAGSDMVRVIKR
jgi:uncharacterized protein